VPTKDILPPCMDAALQLADLGFHVFPIPGAGKTPFPDSRGFKDATPDPDAVRNLWERFPGTSVAIATGLSGLVVVDIDPRNGGDATLAALEADHGELDTVSATTGGGGTHYYYRSPVPIVIPSRANALGPGVDVKASGGYVIAPPSIHESGSTYRWNGGGSPFQRDPEALPDWMLKRLQTVRPVTPRPTTGDRIPAGRRPRDD